MNNVDDFITARQRWLSHVASMVLHGTPLDEQWIYSRFSEIERALALVHVGMGHLIGITDEDIASELDIPPSEVSTLISQVWRASGMSPVIATRVSLVWRCLYEAGSNFELLQTSALKKLWTSQVAQHLGVTSAPPRSHPKALIRELLDNSSAEPLDLSRFPNLNFSMDISGSHLGALRALWRTASEDDLLKIVSILEYISVLPDDEDDSWNLASARRAMQTLHIYRSMPGGWPESNGNQAPDWVRDVVTTQGARLWYASSGCIPAVLIVAESEAELRAMHAWSYQPEFSLNVSRVGVLVLIIVLRFEDDTKAHLKFHYTMDAGDLEASLLGLLSVHILRIELYKLGERNQLDFVTSFGTPLPPALVEAARRHISRQVQGSEGHSSQPTQVEVESDTEAWLKLMSHGESNLFGNILPPQLHESPPEPVVAAFRDFLHAVNAASASSLRGMQVDLRQYGEAKERLRVAVSKYEHPAPQSLPIELLGPGRAYIQFWALTDSAVLRAHSAFVDSDAERRYRIFDLSSHIDPTATFTSNEELCDHLTQGLEEVASLKKEGVNSIVVCPGPGIYNLPFHEALLRLGYEEVSYTHRLATLRPPSPNAKSRPPTVGDMSHKPLVLGYSGQGPQHIASVDVELAFVKHILHGDGGTAMPSILPRLAHFAGHAVTGRHGYEVGMWVAPEPCPPTSAARILLDVDARQCDLVFLSACSTGAGTIPAGELIDMLPLDAAFIEKGARAVVSTSAPVNDQLACYFACLFYDELEQGASIWESFMAARTGIRTVDFNERHARVYDFFDTSWPTWREDLSRQILKHPDDWMLYRISGRHW